MKRVDQNVVRSLLRLRGTPEFNSYVDWLRERLSEYDQQLRSAEGVPLHRAQGAAAELAKLIEIIDDAPDIAARMNPDR